MDTDRKQKLIDLEAASLADALLELAAQSGAADDLVGRLIATPGLDLGVRAFSRVFMLRNYHKVNVIGHETVSPDITPGL